MIIPVYSALCLFLLTVSAGAAELYSQFQPKQTSRIREGIEWSTTYSYNARDNKSPRVLLIGDSICNGYHADVRKELGKHVNVTFWATSKCVTDSDYFRELDFILSACPYNVISFNNGLHSLGTNRKEWEDAFRGAVKFIKAKTPKAKLFLTNSTPLKDPARTAKAKELNAIMAKIAAEEKVPLIDLFSAMDPLDRNQNWSDVYHFKPAARKQQAKIISDTVLKELNISRDSKGNVIQQGTATGPSGALK